MQFASRLLKLIAAIGCVLLGPILVLAGLAGYFDLACSGDDQGLSWAVLLVILIPLMFPVQVAVFCCPPNRQQTHAHHIYHSKLGVCADHLRRGTIVGLDDTRLGVLRVGRLLG